MYPRSEHCFSEAKNLLVGGVNSPVRSFNSVGGTPIFMQSGSGSRLLSEDNESYVDYVLSYGPLLLGHAHPVVTQAIHKAADLGTSFGSPTVAETRLAAKIKQHYPYIDKVRLVNSGTEAVMSAIRLARGFTQKSIIVKFEGCYHGHSDALLVSAGSGLATHSEPSSKGVLADIVKHTVSLPYNDTEAITHFFLENHQDIAAVLIEPVAGNMGLVLPELTFIQKIRDLCSESNALLIFDEVMCGFRSQQGGTHQWLGLEPDIVVLGKVIGAGLPCGAYAAKKDIMRFVSPEGSVYQAGTLSGNPLVMAAGLACLTLLDDGSEFKRAESYTEALCSECETISRHYKVPVSIARKGSMFTLFFSDRLPTTFKEVLNCDFAKFSQFFHAMLKNGVYLPPSQYEACFVSSVHTKDDLLVTIEAFKKSIQGLM
jgi:glutamate-1-semialdehyde 2,1-aminomutase